MRIKQLWGTSAVLANLGLVWSRISFSRLTLIYFIFSVLHFIIQLSLQIKAFTINDSAAQFLNNILEQAQTTNDSLPFVSGSTLRLCEWVPLDVNIESCPIVWSPSAGKPSSRNSEEHVKGVSSVLSSSVTSLPYAASTFTSSSLASSTALASTASPLSSALPSSSVPSATSAARASSSAGPRVTTTIFVPASTVISKESTSTHVENDGEESDGEESDGEERDNEDGSDVIEVLATAPRLIKRDQLTISPFEEGGQVKINITGGGHTPTTLDSTCLWALNWPASVVDNTKREDIVFIAFQFWVLGMSIVALLNESIPHIFASLATHMMATAWAGFQISHTANFRSTFTTIITNGACKGPSLLPQYWEARRNAEIPSLALNVFALLVSCFLTWKLIKLFGWQTFKRVGASLTINRVYKFVLSLSIAIQLSVFFMAVTVSLWLDQLFNSVIGDLVDFLTLYKVTSFIALALLVPWLMSGWFAVRRELRAPMFVFLILSILYLGAWGVMFFSTTFRWTFITWRFFSIMATASVFLTVMSVVLGVICRFNFGKGLLRYLNAAQSLPGDDFPVYSGGSDVEKVQFPSNEKPIPTYSAAFGTGPEVPVPSQMFAARGPRFLNTSAEPFETPTNSNTTSIASLPPAVTRNLTDGLNQSAHIQRNDSYGSTKSSGSMDSYRSYSRSNSEHSRNDSQYSEKKRWVIE